MGNEYKAVHEMLGEEPRPATEERAMPVILMLGFKFLAWVNGLGVMLVVLCALGIVPTEVPAYFLKMPLVAFLSGMALAGLGLLWLYMAHASQGMRQLSARRRYHWLPVFCMLASYCVSMVMFAVGCWLLLGLGSLANDKWDFGGYGGSVAPYHQSADPDTFEY